MSQDRTDALISLCKRRGFVFPSSEIYGGTRSAWDYGPLGVELKENIRREWWNAMVRRRDDVVGLDSAVVLNRQVWEASGHVKEFTDPLTECQSCHKRFRADHLIEAYQEKHDGREPEGGLRDLACPHCGARDSFTEPRMFNGLMKTYLGATEETDNEHFLRPETAQGIFVNFTNVMTSARKKPPFGIAQTGKSFRNEITPGNFIFRTREFEQMEMEFFVPPDEGQKWFEYWCEERLRWYVDLGIPAEKLRLRHHDPEELSHYSAGTADVEFDYPWGWGELEGVANRTDYDLTQHAKFSGERLEYYDQAANERYVPHVIEPAAGVGRSMMAFLLAAYDEDEIGGEKRTVLRLHKKLAPFKVAVLPLSKKETLTPTAREVLKALQPHFMCDYDETQSIGRRYR
ncbi:MAG TPA: glycine--tRNA ligase, partial [Glycomyces sp.]|nr:glycine--tRNA ligase [Glycomyces sp.]